MQIRNAWYAGAWSGELGRRPLGRWLLGRRVALFRDSQGRASAVAARCPHRGADLAQGRCIDGMLECPFHGWRFDARGTCTSIPSQPASSKIPKNADLLSFAVAERDGLVWLRCDTGQGAPAGAAPPPRASEGRRVFVAPTLIQAPFLTVLENALDIAHNAFIHRGSFGPRLDPLVPRQRVSRAPEGSRLMIEDDPESPWRSSGPLVTGFFGWVGRLLGQAGPTVRTSCFELGGRVTTGVQYASGRRDHFTLNLTPAQPGHTWVFYESMRTRMPSWAGDPLQRSFMKRILAEGERETEFVLDASLQENREVSVEADRVALAARKFYAEPMHGGAES